MPQYTGVNTVPSGQDMAVGILDGILKGYLMRRQERLQQEQTQGQQQHQMNYLTKQYELSGAQQAQRQEYETGQADASREQRLSDADKAFKKSLFVAAAEKGAMTPELLEMMNSLEDLDDASKAALKALSDTTAKRYQDDQALKNSKTEAGGKERKPTDLSTAKADIEAVTGFPVSGDAALRVATLADETGRSVREAMAFLYPDVTQIPKADASPGKDEASMAKTLRDWATSRPESLVEMKKVGIDPVNVAGRVNAGEDFDDAYRHETIDFYMEGAGLNPDMPIDVEAVNRVLRDSYQMNPVPKQENATLASVLDDLVARNQAELSKKGRMFDTLTAIVTEAMAPLQEGQERSASPGIQKFTRGVMKVGAALTPGISSRDIQYGTSPQRTATSPLYNPVRREGLRRP